MIDHIHWVVKKNDCYLTVLGWLTLHLHVPHADRWVTPLKSQNPKDVVVFRNKVMVFADIRQARTAAKSFGGKAFRVTRTVHDLPASELKVRSVRPPPPILDDDHDD